MSDSRPDPDALLAHVRNEDERSRRARLKIFLGACAGVGKTYAMLVEAHERRRSGTDVAVGVVETHGRSETAGLTEGLEVLPQRTVDYRGAQMSDFDLDAALTRRPGLLVLDELAHTNAPGSRHRKRWQDVEELLGAGIDVYTTLNVQHVESLVDVVGQVTGITVRETLPDSVLDRADEIELVDLPPDDLLQRLREGKVYLPDHAGRAAQNFFRKGNLIALRELALRQTAQRVDAQMESYRRAAGINDPWAVRERVLVCLGNSENGLGLVRAARRMVTGLKAEWIVAHVETPGQVRESSAERDALVDVMGLAEELGAEAVALTGLRVADELLHLARERHVSRIVLGMPHSPWSAWLPGSLVQRLLHNPDHLDVHLLANAVQGEARPRPAEPRGSWAWRAYAGAVPLVGACTLLAWMMVGAFELSNLAMVYLLGVAVAAVAFGRGPAIFAALLSVVLFDFCFVPPRFQLSVSDTQYVVTFGVMLVVALVIGTLTARTREQAQAARARERRTAGLFHLSQELSVARTVERLVEVAVARVRDISGSRVALMLPGEHGTLAAAGGDAELFAAGDREIGVAQWAYDHAEAAGVGTDTLPASRALHLPLVASGAALGVLSLQPGEGAPLTDRDRLRLVRTFANQVAVALERAQLAERAEAARVDAETERARNALLSSVSHDLRTPLAVITGAATGLRDAGDAMPASTRFELADTIADEATRLNRLVGELLDMTRLESGAMAIRSGWHSPAEIVGGVLERLERADPARKVSLVAAPGLPLVCADEVLVGQAVHNLVENALQHTDASLPVEVVISREGDEIEIGVLDRGLGLAPGEEKKVFEKFYRGAGRRDRHGAGLGLTIALGIVRAHGGTLTAAARPGGGAEFRMRLPVGGEAPPIDPEADEPRRAGE